MRAGGCRVERRPSGKTPGSDNDSSPEAGFAGREAPKLSR
jgi:hypothetical protein